MSSHQLFMLVMNMMTKILPGQFKLMIIVEISTLFRLNQERFSLFFEQNMTSFTFPPYQQMLFYESAKQFHGRMSALRGKYYTSLFNHYTPVDTSFWDFTREVSLLLIRFLPTLLLLHFLFRFFFFSFPCSCFLGCDCCSATPLETRSG
jgi:hypothetical protein